MAKSLRGNSDLGIIKVYSFLDNLELWSGKPHKDIPCLSRESSFRLLNTKQNEDSFV